MMNKKWIKNKNKHLRERTTRNTVSDWTQVHQRKQIFIVIKRVYLQMNNYIFSFFKPKKPQTSEKWFSTRKKK